MNDEHRQLDYMIGRVRAGRMNRREFIGRTTALGVSAGLASALFAKTAQAEAKKGGVLRAGVQGGESTNSLDPALAASDVPFMINKTWGEMLCDVDPGGVINPRIRHA